MQPLCLKCMKNESLRDVVIFRGAKLSQCEICGATDVIALNCDDNELKTKVRSLIRFHYSEWHYNSHMGGDGLESLFYRENPITNFNHQWNQDRYEEAVLEFLEPAYEKYDEGICLYAGYESGVQLSPLVALKNDESEVLLKLKMLSASKNYFLVEKSAAAAIAPRISDFESQLPSGTRLFRSRIGYDARAIPFFGWGDERHYRPFFGSKLSAPPPIVASGGRMNRQGVGFLYLATDSNTAIAETRPHPGHFCSVGEFEALENFRIADLSAVDVTNFAVSDKRLDDFLLLKTLDRLFSIPITPEGRSSYHFTQLLADCFRQLGFDAIRYRSSVGPGTNVVAFHPDKFSFVSDSARVVKVSALSYDYEPMQMIKNEDDYMTRLDGTLL